MSDTPRTDKEIAEYRPKSLDFAWSLVDLCRELEREVKAMTLKADKGQYNGLLGPNYREAFDILLEMHKHMDFQEPMEPNEVWGVDDPSAINALYARAYALINGTDATGRSSS